MEESIRKKGQERGMMRKTRKTLSVAWRNDPRLERQKTVLVLILVTFYL